MFYISYKQSGLSNIQLKMRLNLIRQIFNFYDLEHFIWYFDKDFNNLSKKEILVYTKKKIKDAKYLLCFVNYKDKSEGMFEELGIAYGLNKKIISFVNIKVRSYYWSLDGISNQIYYFINKKDFSIKLNNFLKLISQEC